jgi:hypothetical protein
MPRIAAPGRVASRFEESDLGEERPLSCQIRVTAWGFSQFQASRASIGYP